MRGVGLGGAVGLGGQNPVEGDGGAACSSCCYDLPLGWNRPQIWNLNNGSGPTWWACSHGHRPVSNMCRIRTWGGKTFKVLVPKVFFFFFFFLQGKFCFLKAPEPSKLGINPKQEPLGDTIQMQTTNHDPLCPSPECLSAPCRHQAAVYTLADSMAHEVFMPCTSLPSVDGTSTYLTPNMPFPPLFIGFEGFFFFFHTPHAITATPWTPATFSGM